MDKIIIHGGKKLQGTIAISGSKNAALPILVATLLTDEECVITNVPQLADISTTIALLTHIGKKVIQKEDRIVVSRSKPLSSSAPYDLVRKMRASVLVMGPLAARLGNVKVSLPGGCAIGARPVDIHLQGFERLGAKINVCEGYIELKSQKLIGNKIAFRYPSVGATENLLLASVLAKGTTVIENAAREPEIEDLACVLNKMGAHVIGAGSKRIVITGTDSLRGFTHSVSPDRIETATYLIAAAITKGDVTLTNTDASFLTEVIDKLVQSGVRITSTSTGIRATWVKPLKPVSIKSEVYPGFPTDVQAQWMALMTTAQGESRIQETVFENRFTHACELQRLGADLKIMGHTVVVKGVPGLSGAPVMVSDLRAGAALVLAGLVAKGKTEILRIYHLDRGYEHLEKKLRKLGAGINRVPA